MHDLQACLFKYSTVAAFHIYAQHGEDASEKEVGGHAFLSNGNYIVDHGKSWKNHMFLNLYGNLVGRQIVNTFSAVCFVVCHYNILKATVANIVDLHVSCLIWVLTVHG